MSFRNDREIKTFSNKKSWEFIAGRPVLQETLGEIIWQKAYDASKNLDLYKEIQNNGNEINENKIKHNSFSPYILEAFYFRTILYLYKDYKYIIRKFC